MRLLCLMIFIQTSNILFAHVVISQIMYDSPYNEQITKYPYSDGEFVELHNTGVEDVSLDGWQLWGGGSTERYSFPNNTLLPAGGYMAVAFRYYVHGGDFNISTMTAQYSCYPNYPVQEQRVIILSNTGELLSLRNAQGVIVDSIRYKRNNATTNLDSIPYMECKSWHRTTIRIKDNGDIINTIEDWHSEYVSFGCDVPIEQYIIDEASYHYSQNVSLDRNYMVAVHPLDETTNVTITNGNVSIADNARAYITYNYYDDLGRPEEIILRKLSPNGTDLASFVTYNMAGKTCKKWLPAPYVGNGYISPSALANTISDYYHDTVPFVHTTYKSSPIGEPASTTIPGTTYQSHPNIMDYGTNGPNEIIHFSVSQNGIERNAFYSAGTLKKSIQIDADGKQQITYTDIRNRIIMQQIGTINKTYYVYDAYGRLCYVIPEVLASRLTNGITPDDNADMKRYAYTYHYDSKDNITSKQLPGCEPVFMVYDNASKIILSQDGNQRNRGDYWSYIAYDQLDRIIYTAEICLPNICHQDLVIQLKDTILREMTSTSGIGYTRSYFPTAPTKMLTVSYYDDYNFLQLFPQDTAQFLQYQEKNGYGLFYNNTRNMLTGQKIYNLSDSSCRVSVVYYDIYGNIIQQRSTASLSDFHVQHFAYNHDGTMRQLLDEWNDMTEHYQYVYDYVGRLLKTLYYFNNNPVVVLTANEYDAIGNHITKVRHRGLDKESFNYDLRRQLTKITSGDFTEQLFYADSLPQGASATYNGNIAATSISQGGTNIAFRYQYDQQNWLLTSSLFDGVTNNICEDFEYDALGNITKLKRYNHNGTIMDDLLMQYDGNQLTVIQENVANTDLCDVKEYVANPSGSDMQYDANGNLVVDSDRSINEIKYNILNLPDTICFANGSQIIYLYDALGTKIKTMYLTMMEPVLISLDETSDMQTHYSLCSLMEIWYDGNRQKERVFSQDSIWHWYKEIIFNSEGYVENTVNDSIITEQQMYYFRRDHIGNNVAVWKSSMDGTPQRMFYYASGLPMANSIGQDFQSIKYNNKEFEETNGLNEYDSKARWYYPAICRTTTLDPLCEKYYNISPYAWCGNNLVNTVDLNGCDTLNAIYNSETGYWEWSKPIIAQGNDVINVTDKDGNTSTYEFSEGEYGKRVNMLNLENTGEGKDGYVLGVYHVSGVEEGGTGFYVTPGGEASNKEESGRRIIDGTYPIIVPHDKAEWKYPGVGGDVKVRGSRFHYGYPYPRGWSKGCFILFYDYNLVGGKVIVTEQSTRTAAINFAHLMGGVGIVDYSFTAKDGTVKNRTGVSWYPYGINDKLILKSR